MTYISWRNKVLLLLISLSLISCVKDQPASPLPPEVIYQQYRPLIQASVTLAVGFYLSEFPERTESVYTIATNIYDDITRFETTDFVSLVGIEGIARSYIPFDELDANQANAVNALLVAVRVAAETVLRDNNIQEPEVISFAVHDIVFWIQQSALVQCSAYDVDCI